MQAPIMRHIADVSRLDFDWTSKLAYLPPRPQDDPEHIAVDLMITLASGQRVQSSLIIMSPKAEDQPVPLSSISWLKAESSTDDPYTSFARFRRALIEEAARHGLSPQRQTLQASFGSACSNAAFDAELAIFSASDFLHNELSNPKLLKLPELDWCILFESAIWQTLPGHSHARALMFLKALIPQLVGIGSREALKQLVVDSTLNESFLTLFPPTESAVRRQPIPEAVRHEVWRRDRGDCVTCGSQAKIEFDHIIPYSRGGSDTARNIQLLCEACNRRKSARI